VPRDQLVENRGQREDIGGGRGRGTGDHLGRKVGTDGCAVGRSRIGKGREGARETEVGDPDPSGIAQPDGGGMDTAVADLGVRRLDSVGGVAKQNMRVGKADDLVLGSPRIHDLPERCPVRRLGRQVDALPS
jgi:hypothetical protein